MTLGRASTLLIATALLTCSVPASARVMPLKCVPPDKLVTLAPLLRHADMALVESNPDGTEKQISLFLFVRARPEMVHEVIGNPADYKRFIRNMSRSNSVTLPDGTVRDDWRLELPVSEFDGINIYRFEPGPAGPIDVHAVDSNDSATYHWVMLPVPGGTLLAMYGYTDVRHSNAFVQRYVKRQATMEHGLALAAQLLYAASMKREAERRTVAASLAPLPPAPAQPPSFGFLLDRGQVAIIRSEVSGHFVDVSVIDRAYAPLKKVEDAVENVGQYAKFIPGVEYSVVRSPQDGSGASVYSMEMSIPFISWTTTYAMRVTPGAVDGYATEGDLHGARYRWDLTAEGPKRTLVVYRVSQALAQGTFFLKKLFNYEPELERGINVALALVYVRAVRGRAEGWATK